MSDALLKWRRTSFTRLDGSVEVALDDWVLKEPGWSYGRIYRITGGPKHDQWFWCAYLHDRNGHPLDGGAGDAPSGRHARQEVEQRQPDEVRARIVRGSSNRADPVNAGTHHR